MTTATERVLSSTEGARQPPATKKTGRSRWNCWTHIKEMASKGRKWCIEHEIFPETFSTTYKGNEDWLLSCSSFQTPLYPPFLPNASILPHLLLFPSLWSGIASYQPSEKPTHPPAKGKVESRAEMSKIQTQSAEETQQSWGHMTEDTKGTILPLLHLGKWRCVLFQDTQISSFLSPVWKSLW